MAAPGPSDPTRQAEPLSEPASVDTLEGQSTGLAAEEGPPPSPSVKRGLFAWPPLAHPRWARFRIGLALAALFSIIAVDELLITARPRAEVTATLAQVGFGTMSKAAPPRGGAAKPGELVAPAVDLESAALAKIEGAAPPPPAGEDPSKDEEKEPAEPKRFSTVKEAAARSCSTSSVDGLSRQIIAQARCIDDRAFAPVPPRSNLVTGSHVFLYLDATARDRLVAALDENKSKTMTVNSGLRTVAQQYLLFRWSKTKRCGIQLASNPGESNHETGLALDITEPQKWRPILEAKGFRWLGAIDRVHFDFKGPGASSRRNIDVLAFQQLWNRNHPDDAIPENGRYSSELEARLKKSPAGGFPQGARCGGGGERRIAAEPSPKRHEKRKKPRR